MVDNNTKLSKPSTIIAAQGKELDKYPARLH
jgi:hypothetical protein